jgi:chromosome segregation ATPase
LKKFNEERKTRQIAEDKALELDRSIKMLNSDIKYLKEDLNKKEKEFNDELAKYISIKKELDAELTRRSQELNELNSESSNLRIKEKHLNKINGELKEENFKLKNECDKLRKISLDTENTKIKKLQEEIDELKTINQLYRSQRLESDEEISNHVKEKEKYKYELAQHKKEL